jgi:uncharacterized protein YprB with RNaseH-like and TPR domain
MVLVKGKLNEQGLYYVLLNLHPKLNFEGVVLDLETTDYEPQRGEIICAGFIYGNKALVLMRTKKLSKERFYEKLRKFVTDRIKKQTPFFAYNAPFERKWLKEHLNIQLEIGEIMKPAKALTYKIRDLKGWHKTPKLRELLHPRFFHYFGFEGWDIDSGEVKKLWEEHLCSGDLKPLNLIAQHNLIDILSELELLTVWNPYMEEFLNNRMVVKRYTNLRCEICKKEKPIEELAVVTYPAGKDGKGFLFKEKRICKDCLRLEE